MYAVTILLLPLVAGYAYVTTFFFTQYLAARETGYRLYFRAAFYGLWLFMLACLCYLLIVGIFSQFWQVPIWLYAPVSTERLVKDLSTQNSLIEAQIQATLIQVSILSVLLGVALGHLITQFLHFTLWLDNQYKAVVPYLSALLRLRSKAYQWIIRNDEFEKLLLKSVEEELQVCFTLKTGKAYVGYVVTGVDPCMERSHVRILPMRSGYRSQNQTLHFTTLYYHHYSKFIELQELYVDDDHQEFLVPTLLNPESYEIVIPCEEIITGNIFLDEAYDLLNFHASTEQDSSDTQNRQES